MSKSSEIRSAIRVNHAPDESPSRLSHSKKCTLFKCCSEANLALRLFSASALERFCAQRLEAETSRLSRERYRNKSLQTIKRSGQTDGRTGAQAELPQFPPLERLSRGSAKLPLVCLFACLCSNVEESRKRGEIHLE